MTWLREFGKKRGSFSIIFNDYEDTAFLISPERETVLRNEKAKGKSWKEVNNVGGPEGRAPAFRCKFPSLSPSSENWGETEKHWLSTLQF